jgi:phage shock protein A
VPNLIVSAVSTFDNKGLKKGKKEISAFDKNVQSLGKTFAKVFGTIAIANFAKNAVNAFIESEKAAAKLRTTVSNLGLEFEQPGIEDYLKKLSLQFGIVDESLIPGFQRLLIVTKDVAKAQSLFETALNVSAGTGKDLTAVSTSLSKAYLGDNAALGRLGVGLSKAQLKSASFLEVQRTLNVNFAGQAAATVEGYAGSMAKLTVAVDESKEAIGKGLLDAIAALSGSNDIDTFTVKMVNAAEKIGNAFRTVGDVIGLLNPNASVKVGGKFLRKSDMNAPRLSPATSRAILLRQEVTQIKTGVSLRKQENAALKAKTAVDQLRDKFDIERIGLTAALNAATDDETKLRLRAQLAILDNNEALAKKLLAEMEGTKATVQLTTQFYALSEATRALLTSFGVSASQIGPGGTIVGGASGRIGNLASTSINNPNFASSGAGMDLGLALGFTPGSRSNAAPTEVIVTVNTANSGDRLSQAIAESIQIATRSGYSTVPAGFL